MSITELAAAYKTGELTFNDVLEAIPQLTWGQRHEEVDGEVWWDGENTVADVDLFWYEGYFTDDERDAIMNAIATVDD